MRLTLIPQLGTPDYPEMTIHVAGDVLTIDGTPHDLSAIPEGGAGIPGVGTCFVGRIHRIGGMINATLIARLDGTASDDTGGPWVIDDADGAVVIPANRRSAPEPMEEEAP